MTDTTTTTTRPRVYLAHPITTYGTAHEAAVTARIAEILPGVELFDPSGRYVEEGEWEQAWPEVLRSLSGLVVFGDEDETIGTGCWREIGDALSCYLPVAALSETTLCHLAGVALMPAWKRTRSRAGLLLYGPEIDPAEFLADVEGAERVRALHLEITKGRS